MPACRWRWIPVRSNGRAFCPPRQIPLEPGNITIPGYGAHDIGGEYAEPAGQFGESPGQSLLFLYLPGGGWGGGVLIQADSPGQGSLRHPIDPNPACRPVSPRGSPVSMLFTGGTARPVEWSGCGTGPVGSIEERSLPMRKCIILLLSAVLCALA